MEHSNATANIHAATDSDRAFARQLAAESIANGDATGWFETLYAAAEQGTTTVPWAGLTPSRRLVSALAGLTGSGRALVIGCGLGDDAEHVASLGFTTVAFDVSPTAVAGARRRFPHSTVEYVTADLLSPLTTRAGGRSAAGEPGSPPPTPSIGETPTHSDRSRVSGSTGARTPNLRRSHVQEGER